MFRASFLPFVVLPIRCIYDICIYLSIQVSCLTSKSHVFLEFSSNMEGATGGTGRANPSGKPCVAIWIRFAKSLVFLV
jgi:hypothetical protein